MAMKEHTRFYSSLGRLLVLNALIKPLWIFGIDRPVQNLAGTAIYGTYFSLFNLSFVLSFLLDWGLSSFINREIAAAPMAQQTKTGIYFRIKLLLVLVYALLVFTIARISGIENMKWLWLLIAIQALTSLFLFTRSIISAHQWFGADAWFSVLDKMLMILLCGGFLIFPVLGGLGIDRFLWIQVACTAIALLTALALLLQRGVAIWSVPYKEKVLPLLRSALPYALIVLLMSAHYRLDGFLLERMHPQGAVEAGRYAGAYRLLDAANMAGFLFASFLLPFVARHQQALSKANEAVLFIRHFLLLLSTGITVLVLLFSSWIQSLLYHDQSPEAVQIMMYCLPVLTGYSLVQVYGTVLTATGHIQTFCMIVAGALLMNTLLNLLWIPSMGALGSCYAALISHSVCGITCMLVARKKTGISLEPRSLILTILIGAILFSFLYFGQSMITNLPLLISIAVILVIVLAFITGLFDPKKWKSVFITQ